jgi:hypothetical protein
MTPSDAHASSSSHRVLDDLVGITENLASGADPAALLRELLLATGMTLKNPSGIVAANTRLARGSAGGVPRRGRPRDGPRQPRPYRDPPDRAGSDDYPPIEKAPGSYVFATSRDK